MKRILVALTLLAFLLSIHAQERRVLLAKKIAAEEKTRQEIDRMQNLREQSTSVNDNLINRIPRDILGTDDEML